MSSSSGSSSSCSFSVLELDSRIFCGDGEDGVWEGLQISRIQVIITLKYSQGINNTKQAIAIRYPIIKCGHRSAKHRSVSSFCYEVMKSAVALWDAAGLVLRSLCPGNFSLWWVGEENSGFAYANGPPSFFLLFFLKSLCKQIRKLHKQFSFFC